MDEGFMFSERNENAYEDNAAFLTKVLTPGRFVLMLVLLLLSGAAMINIGAVYIAPKTEGSMSSATVWDNVYTSLFWSYILSGAAMMIYAAGALVSAANSAAKKLRPLSPALFLAGAVFDAAASLLLSFLDIFGLLNASGIFNSGAAREVPDNTILSLSFVSLPFVLHIFTSVSGIAFFISVLSTVRGKGLFLKGAKPYSFLLILNALSLIACSVFFAVNVIAMITASRTGMGNLSSIDLEVLFSMGKNALLIAAIIAPLIYAPVLIKRYRIAVEYAERSIRQSGVNMYMNGDGEAARFFQSVYTSPDNDIDSPPTQADNSKDI